MGWGHRMEHEKHLRAGTAAGSIFGCGARGYLTTGPSKTATYLKALISGI